MYTQKSGNPDPYKLNNDPPAKELYIGVIQLAEAINNGAGGWKKLSTFSATLIPGGGIDSVQVVTIYNALFLLLGAYTLLLVKAITEKPGFAGRFKKFAVYNTSDPDPFTIFIDLKFKTV